MRDRSRTLKVLFNIRVTGRVRIERSSAPGPLGVLPDKLDGLELLQDLDHLVLGLPKDGALVEGVLAVQSSTATDSL